MPHLWQETLSGRDAVADDHRAAVKASIQKRRNIEKLKSASSLRSDKVNEALEDLDEVRRLLSPAHPPRTDVIDVPVDQAQHYEETLARRLQGISTNLQPSLTRHSVDTHTDLLNSLLEHARTTLIYEKQRLKEYETVRPEMRAIKRPEAGVIYHTTPTPAATSAAGTPGTAGPLGGLAPGMGRVGSTGSDASSGTGTVAPSTYGGGPAPGRSAPSSPLATPRDPLAVAGSGHASSMAHKVEKRTIRNMASSVQVEGDKRHRVDVSPYARALFLPFFLLSNES